MVGMASGGIVFYYQHHHFCLSASVICLVTGSLLTRKATRPCRVRPVTFIDLTTYFFASVAYGVLVVVKFEGV
jgi:hypothetical protein